MMRRLVERHAGILPLDTVESIWRVIIATFTYVQAPFRVHADFSAGESAMRDCERFHFGFTVPLIGHIGAAGVVAAVAAAPRRSRPRTGRRRAPRTAPGRSLRFGGLGRLWRTVGKGGVDDAGHVGGEDVALVVRLELGEKARDIGQPDQLFGRDLG